MWLELLAGSLFFFNNGDDKLAYKIPVKDAYISEQGYDFMTPKSNIIL